MSLPPTGSVAEHPSAGETGEPRKKSGVGRLISVDFVRGDGILCFIYWHAANYFLEGGSWASPSVRATLFSTGLFIFTAGLLLGLHYGPKYRLPEKRSNVARRLVIRGAKLFLLFLIFLLAAMVSRGFRLEAIKTLLLDVASLHYIQRWDIPLQILVPISALLLTGPVLLAAGEKLGPKLAAGALILVGAVDALLPQPIPYFWHYYLIGFAGLSAGGYAASNWDSLSEFVRSKGKVITPLIVALFLILDGTAYVAQRPYEILLHRLFPNFMVITAFFLVCTLPPLRRIDLGGGIAGPIARALATKGKHTLACYLLQVFVLTLLKKSRLVATSESILWLSFNSAGVAATCPTAGLLAESLWPNGCRIFRSFLG